jgi:hypothetical protein
MNPSPHVVVICLDVPYPGIAMQSLCIPSWRSNDSLTATNTQNRHTASRSDVGDTGYRPGRTSEIGSHFWKSAPETPSIADIVRLPASCPPAEVTLANTGATH